jgi:HEAT repeat protein
MVVAGLALVAGAVIVGSRFWPGKEKGGGERARPVEASTGAVPAAVAGAAASTQAPSEPPRLDAGQLYERALGDLKGLMGSASARVQRIAAMALARTGDQAAMARLRGLLAAEKNPLVRVEIAYALARVGDQDGLGELHAALKSSQRRDARLDAARSLVLLDDSRGADQLREFLSYTEYRIGAAGLLARIGDEKGIAALRQAIAERKRFPENEMRAVVALGAAGDRSVQPRLLEILRDGRYQIGACQALAVLGDPAAVPALVQQLDVDAFRVAAAVALRRMKAKVDLAPLAAALEGGNDVVRVTAGEAILVLTGPEKLVERD